MVGTGPGPPTWPRRNLSLTWLLWLRNCCKEILKIYCLKFLVDVKCKMFHRTKNYFAENCGSIKRRKNVWLLLKISKGLSILTDLIWCLKIRQLPVCVRLCTHSFQTRSLTPLLLFEYFLWALHSGIFKIFPSFCFGCLVSQDNLTDLTLTIGLCRALVGTFTGQGKQTQDSNC